jgi:hypothetical protein
MTPGFLAIRAHGKTHAAYNHADSYPTWLGVQAAEFIRTYDLEQAAMEADLLTHVDEDEYPTAEQLENFKARGITPQHFGARAASSTPAGTGTARCAAARATWPPTWTPATSRSWTSTRRSAAPTSSWSGATS